MSSDCTGSGTVIVSGIVYYQYSSILYCESGRKFLPGHIYIYVVYSNCSTILCTVLDIVQYTMDRILCGNCGKKVRYLDTCIHLA